MVMIMMDFLKGIAKKILFPHTYSSEAYINYLKKQGVKIGHHCHIYSPNHTIIDCQRPHTLFIGDYCKITQGVTILSHDYSMSVVKRKYHEHIGDMGITIIGNNVFIGMNTIILMGSEIGNNCIIGAGSIVSGKYPSDSVIAGNPARVICTIDDYYIKKKKQVYDKAKRYYILFKQSYGRKPTVEEMGNAFAWLYLPRNEESLFRYEFLFKLSGDNIEETKKDFLNSVPMFKNYDEFCESVESEIVLGYDREQI